MVLGSQATSTLNKISQDETVFSIIGHDSHLW